MIDRELDLGRVLLRREGLGDKLLQAIGFDDIDLEDPEFSKRYVVQAKNRKDAYDLLDGPMMRFLTARVAPDLETRGRELFLHLAGKPAPEDYAALAGFALELLAQFPRPPRERRARPARAPAARGSRQRIVLEPKGARKNGGWKPIVCVDPEGRAAGLPSAKLPRARGAVGGHDAGSTPWRSVTSSSSATTAGTSSPHPSSSPPPIARR